MTEPAEKHKAEAREITEQWRFAIPHGAIGRVNYSQWDDLEHRIAFALASRDAEVREALEGLSPLLTPVNLTESASSC